MIIRKEFTVLPVSSTTNNKLEITLTGEEALELLCDLNDLDPSCMEPASAVLRDFLGELVK